MSSSSESIKHEWNKIENIPFNSCKVPECELNSNNRDIPFDQPWLHDAIPFSDDKIDSCYRYAPKNNTDTEFGQCSADMFDKTRKIECTEYVYGSDEKNVQTEVSCWWKIPYLNCNKMLFCLLFQLNIHCSDAYKLALIGTAGNIGRFLFLPVFGFLADK